MKAKCTVVAFDEAISWKGSGSRGLPQSEWLLTGLFPVIGQGSSYIEGWSNREDLVIDAGDGLVLYGGHTRRSKHVKGRFIPGPNVKILNPKACLDSKYLHHYLSSAKIPNKGYADHFSEVRRLHIPLPPLEEQRRVAAILDKAQHLRLLAERASKLQESLIDAFFFSRVGDPTKDSWQLSQAGTPRLSEIAHIRTGKLDANAAIPNGPYPFFTCSRTTLSIDSYCFDGEAVLVAGNGDLNVKRHSGKLNAYQRTYIISPKSRSPEEADYIYGLLRLYVDKLRQLSIGGVIKYIKLPFLAELPVGPLNSGIAHEISSLRRKLMVGSDLRSSSWSRLNLLESTLAAELLGF